MAGIRRRRCGNLLIHSAFFSVCIGSWFSPRSFNILFEPLPEFWLTQDLIPFRFHRGSIQICELSTARCHPRILTTLCTACMLHSSSSLEICSSPHVDYPNNNNNNNNIPPAPSTSIFSILSPPCDLIPLPQR